jgi:hypothetical protein
MAHAIGGSTHVRHRRARQSARSVVGGKRNRQHCARRSPRRGADSAGRVRRSSARSRAAARTPTARSPTPPRRPPSPAARSPGAGPRRRSASAPGRACRGTCGSGRCRAREPDRPVDAKAQAKRRQARADRVAAALDELDPRDPGAHPVRRRDLRERGRGVDQHQPQGVLAGELGTRRSPRRGADSAGRVRRSSARSRAAARTPTARSTQALTQSGGAISGSGAAASISISPRACLQGNLRLG